MAKSDLKIKATNSQGANMTTTIGYVNPYATNAQLATLGNRINQFTTNVYDHSEKVTTVNVDGEEGKTVPTLTITSGGNPLTEYTLAETAEDVVTTHFAHINYTGNGALTVTCPYMAFLAFMIWDNADCGVVYGIETPSGTYPFTITSEETDTYAAASYSFTLIIE